MEKLYQKLPFKNKKLAPDKYELATIITKLESDDTQIDLGIKIKKDNEIKKIKRHTRTWFRIAHINPYWKSLSPVAMIILSVCSSGFFIYLLITQYSTLPAQIPLLYNQGIHSWTYISKDEILIIPIVHLLLSFIFQNINMVIFKFDRRLVLVINNALILFNIIYLLEIIEIYIMLVVH